MPDSDEIDPTERSRPRVVDKRVSARGEAPSPAPEPPAPKVEPPAPAAAPDPELAAAPDPEPPAGAASERPWTPEQEEEARALIEHMTNTPSIEWVLNSTVTLANLADTKIRSGNHTDAQLPIDALAGILNEIGPRLGEFEKPLRQTLTQLQMAFANAASSGPDPS